MHACRLRVVRAELDTGNIRLSGGHQSFCSSLRCGATQTCADFDHGSGITCPSPAIPAPSSCTTCSKRAAPEYCPVAGGCGAHASCLNCTLNGCAWCSARRACVEIDPRSAGAEVGRGELCRAPALLIITPHLPCAHPRRNGTQCEGEPCTETGCLKADPITCPTVLSCAAVTSCAACATAGCGLQYLCGLLCYECAVGLLSSQCGVPRVLRAWNPAPTAKAFAQARVPARVLSSLTAVGFTLNPCFFPGDRASF